LDIGAGTGRDEAYFAEIGYRVIAVEPTDALRIPGMALHPSPLVEWLDDSLPDLSVVLRIHHTFDLLMLTAVLMHLDEEQRADAMPNLASLLRSGGMMIISIRHGSRVSGPARVRRLRRRDDRACPSAALSSCLKPAHGGRPGSWRHLDTSGIHQNVKPRMAQPGHKCNRRPELATLISSLVILR
jgi:SAM-dependent methyltransferase